MFKFKNMKHFLLTIIILYPKMQFLKFFLSKNVSNIYMQPSIDSPIIYPIEQGKKLILKKIKMNGQMFLDEKTGLVGWIQKDFLSKKNQKILVKVNYKNSFKIFKKKF